MDKGDFVIHGKKIFTIKKIKGNTLTLEHSSGWVRTVQKGDVLLAHVINPKSRKSRIFRWFFPLYSLPPSKRVGPASMWVLGLDMLVLVFLRMTLINFTCSLVKKWHKKFDSFLFALSRGL